MRIDPGPNMAEPRDTAPMRWDRPLMRARAALLGR
jgi:hypothetical protein